LQKSLQGLGLALPEFRQSPCVRPDPRQTYDPDRLTLLQDLTPTDRVIRDGLAVGVRRLLARSLAASA